MRILQMSIIILLVLSCTAHLAQPQIVVKPIPIKIVKQDTLIKSKDTVVYNDSIDALTMKHYKGLLTAIDWYYKRAKPGQVYRYIPLSLFPYFSYKSELLPKDKPIVYFDAFRYNLMQIKTTQFGGELVAIATVSYTKMKFKRPPVMTYRLNFYEYSAVTDDWRKSEYTTSVDFFLTKDGYLNRSPD
jgi:hypothetical protein